MKDYQREFIRLAIDSGVLRFGDFVLKSGRHSPYFFNTGLFNDGYTLARLGYFYASALVDHSLDFEVLMGPAYKGIPLVAATSVQLFQHFGKNAPWCFNRKEVKDHGEGGLIVGSALRGQVAVIDDVITAGTAIREVIRMIHTAGATPVGVMVALDRQEKGRHSNESALMEISREFAIPVYSIIALEQLLEFLRQDERYSACLPQMEAYRLQYGL